MKAEKVTKRALYRFFNPEFRFKPLLLMPQLFFEFYSLKLKLPF